MAKLTLDTLASLSNETTAISTINDNSDAIEAAIENTLSRDGTSPNSMGADLDMDSNRILNLSAPTTSTEPVRLIDMQDSLGVLTGTTTTPGSTVSQAVVRWGATDGSALASSNVTIDNFENMNVPGRISASEDTTLLYTTADLDKGDIVLGDPTYDGAFQNRHDSSILMWSNSSANRIVSTGNTFRFHKYNSSTPGVILGGSVSDPTYINGSLYPQSVFIKGPYPFVDVRAWGATGDGVTDDYAAINAAIASLGSGAGGIVFFPPGAYYIKTGLILAANRNITLMGSGRTSSYIIAYHDDITLLTSTESGQNHVKDISFLGKGFNLDTSSFGATLPVVVWQNSGGSMTNCTIEGGYSALNISSTDAVFYNVECAEAYGPNLVNISGSNWYYHCKWDHSATVTAATESRPYTAWAALTAYTQGQVRTSDGYALVCKTAGTSAATKPTLKNYGIDITDGTITWELSAPVTYVGVQYDSPAGENHHHDVDLSGDFSHSMLVNSTEGYITQTGGTFSSPISLLQSKEVHLSDSHFGNDITIDTGYTGRTVIVDNTGITTSIDIDITVGANVNDILISNNYLGGGTITTSGTSDRIALVANVNATIADTATGTNKLIVNRDQIRVGGPVLSRTSAGGIGYSTGAGSSATQATSKSTAVAFNAVCGAITMNGAALGAATIVSFTFTNTSIAAGDVLVLNHVSAGTGGAYTLNAQCGAGSAVINVRNNTAGSLSEAIVIQFAVIKGVNS